MIAFATLIVLIISATKR
ncbi:MULTISPECIES: hypothetical protein [Megasphaera]|nr:hypothetical protein [Limosilactobacillus oris]